VESSGVPGEGATFHVWLPREVAQGSAHPPVRDVPPQEFRRSENRATAK
jgi:hypothetical protein